MFHFVDMLRKLIMTWDGYLVATVMKLIMIWKGCLVILNLMENLWST